LSRAEHELTDGGHPPAAAPNDLDELLATLAEAPDLASSAAFLLSRLGELTGSSRGFVRLLDPTLEVLGIAAMVGLEGDDLPPALSVSDLSHPVVIAALSLHPVRCERGAIGDSRVPFRDWIALPLPRGDDRAGPPTIPVSRAADLLAPAGLRPSERPVRQQEWFGHAPAGVVVLDGDPGEAAVAALARVTMFAGPILSRMGMA